MVSSRSGLVNADHKPALSGIRERARKPDRNPQHVVLLEAPTGLQGCLFDSAASYDEHEQIRIAAVSGIGQHGVAAQH
jgi:hypothetical protein